MLTALTIRDTVVIEKRDVPLGKGLAGNTRAGSTS
jgi:hypothetical protein